MTKQTKQQIEVQIENYHDELFEIDDRTSIRADFLRNSLKALREELSTAEEIRV